MRVFCGSDVMLRVNFPLNQPPLSAPHTRTPTPSFRHTSLTSHSTCRSRRFHCCCSETNFGQFLYLLTSTIFFCICQAVRLLAPRYRIFPDVTRSLSVDN